MSLNECKHCIIGGCLGEKFHYTCKAVAAFSDPWTLEAEISLKTDDKSDDSKAKNKGTAVSSPLRSEKGDCDQMHIQKRPILTIRARLFTENRYFDIFQLFFQIAL